jgi:hypothetical protein
MNPYRPVLSWQILNSPGASSMSQPALPQPSAASGTSIISENTGQGIQNTFQDPKSHLIVQYSEQETPFKSNLSCPMGVASVNNDCLCPGGESGVPYRQAIPHFTKSYLNTLFSPIDANMFPEPSKTVSFLIAQRGRCPTSAYRALDSIPITQCLATKCT